MTNVQENKFNMFLVVKTFLIAKMALLSQLPNFATIFDAFTEGLAGIVKDSELQSVNKIGVTKSKVALKLKLSILVGDNARKLFAFALLINDQVLLSELKFPQSTLKNGSDSKLTNRAEGIYNRITPLLSQLAPYGITADSQEAFRSAIDNFVASVPQPRLKDTDSTEITRELAIYFKDTEKALHQLDAIIEIIHLTDTSLYNAYRLARKTVNYGTRSHAIIIKVTDADTHEPIQKVTITLDMENNAGQHPAIVKKSSVMGGCNVKSAAEGTYQVTAKKLGLKDDVRTVQISKGERCNIHIEMKKI